MGDVSTAISKYVDEVIRLARSDISSAVSSREWFLDRVASVIDNRIGEPELFSEERFVKFGSYFKGTQVQAVDEFDILVVIDSNTGIFRQGGNAVGTGKGNCYPNHKYDSTYLKADGSGVSPTKLLNWLKGVVYEAVEPFGGQAPIRNGQAITATIVSKGLSIDLVPAGVFHRDVQSGSEVFYDIPKGNKDDGWIITAPQEDMSLLNAAAKDKDNFRNVVRICKRIKNQYNFLVSSFAIECAGIYYGLLNQDHPWHNDLFLDTRGALEFLASHFRSGNIPDTFDTNTNLLEGVEHLDWYADRIDRIVLELRYLQLSDLDPDAIYRRVFAAFENS